MNDRCWDGRVVCLEGTVLDFGIVVGGWLEKFGVEVIFGGVHSGDVIYPWPVGNWCGYNYKKNDTFDKWCLLMIHVCV